MAKTRIEIAKTDIVKLFENAPSSIFKRSDIEGILTENRDFWRLPSSMTVNQFIQFMLEKTKLKEVRFEFPRTIIRYTWGEVPDYPLILSLSPDGYFTHYTAVYLHNLTEQIPKNIYLNSEQPRKPFQAGQLEQSRIDTAFQRAVRVSSNVALYKDKRIYLLNGMHTGRLGVIEFKDSESGQILTTDIERTLIDATVRPAYSGGVAEVLKAFRLAKEKLSINKLSAYLKNIRYTYPYHQAVGFYLERSGVYDYSLIDLLQKFEIKFDFYLTHQMKETDYSKKWRLYFPKGL